jgi:hypothetical protein
LPEARKPRSPIALTAAQKAAVRRFAEDLVPSKAAPVPVNVARDRSFVYSIVIADPRVTRALKSLLSGPHKTDEWLPRVISALLSFRSACKRSPVKRRDVDALRRKRLATRLERLAVQVRQATAWSSASGRASVWDLNAVPKGASREMITKTWDAFAASVELPRAMDNFAAILRSLTEGRRREYLWDEREAEAQVLEVTS